MPVSHRLSAANGAMSLEMTEFDGAEDEVSALDRSLSFGMRSSYSSSRVVMMALQYLAVVRLTSRTSMSVEDLCNVRQPSSLMTVAGQAEAAHQLQQAKGWHLQEGTATRLSLVVARAETASRRTSSRP